MGEVFELSLNAAIPKIALNWWQMLKGPKWAIEDPTFATAHYQSRWRSSSFAQIGKWYYKYQWGSPDVCNEHRAGWVRTHWWEKIRSLPFIQCKNSIRWCLHDSLTIHSGMNIRFHIAFLSWVLVLNPEFDLTPIDKLHILQYGHFIRLSNPLLEYILLYGTATPRWDCLCLYEQWADLVVNGRKFKVLTHQVDHLRRTFKQQKIY